MKRKATRLAGMTLLLTSALYNCGPSRQETMTREAYKALNKIKSAIEIGVNYQKYMELVVDAKATIDNIAPALGDPYIKGNITKALGYYADALTAWNAKIQGKSFVHVSPIEGDLSIVSEDKSDKVMQVDFYMQAMWDMAQTWVKATATLMERKGWELY